MEKRSALFEATKPSRSFLSAIRTSCKDFVLSGSSMAASIEVVGPLEGIIARRAFREPAKANEEETEVSSDDEPAVLEVPVVSVADGEVVVAAAGTYPGGGFVYRVAGVVSTDLMSRASKLLMIESLSPASVQKARKREIIWL